MSEIEMQDLSPRNDSDGRLGTSTAIRDDSIVSLWAWCATTLLLIISACLTLFSRLLRFLAETDSPNGTLTPLESFLALHFGIFLAAVAVAIVLNIPSADPVARNEMPRHPLLLPISSACVLSAFLAYNTDNVGTLSTVVCFFSSIIGVWGIWEAAFSGSSLVSKKTGADKHTSSFIFGNKNAASMKKKLWREQHRK